jgi:putative glycosyltransferase (TIGR04348 family)
MSKQSPSRRIVIVSPALAAANNGNWHTAHRWSCLLRDDYRVSIAAHWRRPEDGDADALIALHARRSAASIDAFARAHPGRALVVVLTGTDLYRDIRGDAEAQRSLRQATRLVALQAQGPQELPAALRDKCRIVFQSAAPLTPATKPAGRLRVVMAGHLRPEKDPLCFMQAAVRLASRPELRFEHIGDALDPALAEAARDTERATSRYRWLGGLPRVATRQRIRRAHLLVNASRMEGGAQVVIEAVQSGTAVLASRIGGHVGLLGADYAGFFEPGDAAGLARLVARAHDEPAYRELLLEQGRRRAPLFDPGAERASLLHLLHDALADAPAPSSLAKDTR